VARHCLASRLRLQHNLGVFEQGVDFETLVANDVADAKTTSRLPV
jgi:hypothetical protein